MNNTKKFVNVAGPGYNEVNDDFKTLNLAVQGLNFKKDRNVRWQKL